MDRTRRSMLVGALALGALRMPHARAASKPEMTVHKSPTCGCCNAWVEHVRASGYAVVTRDATDLAPVKRKLGVPPNLESCHTAVVEAYVVEGHVPADLIDRLLRDRPAVLGLAVRGMPVGSPGMEVPGQAAQPYRVMAFDRSGRATVYATR